MRCVHGESLVQQLSCLQVTEMFRRRKHRLESEQKEGTTAVLLHVCGIDSQHETHRQR